MTKLLVQLLVGSLALAHLCQGAPRPEEVKASQSSSSSSSISSSSSSKTSTGVDGTVKTVVTTVEEKLNQNPELLSTATSAVSNVLQTVPQTTGDISSAVASILNSLSSISPATSSVANILQSVVPPVNDVIKGTAAKVVPIAIDGTTSQLFTFVNGKLFALVAAPAGLRISSIVQPTILKTVSGAAVIADTKTAVVTNLVGDIVGTLTRGDEVEGLAAITGGVAGIVEGVLDTAQGLLGGGSKKGGLPILNVLSGSGVGGILGGVTKPVTKVLASTST